jgi:hypothetical protein
VTARTIPCCGQGMPLPERDMLTSLLEFVDLRDGPLKRTASELSLRLQVDPLARAGVGGTAAHPGWLWGSTTVSRPATRPRPRQHFVLELWGQGNESCASTGK